MAAYKMESCVRGYHIYKDLWDASIGDDTLREREPFNDANQYGVAVLKDDTVVSHIPRKISRICSLFLARGGAITCIPIGRRYFSDLPQGELEIPCKLAFTGKLKEVENVKTFFARKTVASNRVPKPIKHN